jgi:hypothetical protein
LDALGRGHEAQRVVRTVHEVAVEANLRLKRGADTVD